jgi:class 3 adenylate cyclase/predicted ATPase
MKCPQCNADNPPKNKFCGSCGYKFQKAATEDRMDIIRKDIPESLVKKIIHTKDTIEKERKDVTVIFADISGFTTMSEALDPEELTILMNECFRKLGAMIYRYEGIIDKFIGDCIMAIFGAPVTHEDDPERAILACLDMQNALNEINNSLDPSLKKLAIHSGVNTGVVIAGKVGSDLQMDYTVMGDTVNVAQRLKDISPQGGILAGEETYNRSRHAFDFLPHEAVQLKGKKEKVKPFEVVGRKWGSEFGLGAVHSDMVGRDQELSRLKKGYEDLKQGRSSVFVIRGEIGVGKSRLLYEFKKYLTMSAPDIALIDSRGVSYESQIPLKSFADSLRHFLTAGKALSLEVSEKPINDRLKSILAKEADDIVPYLLKMMNMTLDKDQVDKVLHLDGHSLQLQIFLAVATLFENLTKEKPLILIVDDIQWLDSTTIELLNFLLPMVKKKRLSLYLSYRIGNVPNIQSLLKTISTEYEKYALDVDIKNLDPEHSSQLINNLISQEMPQSLRDFIIAKSGGNPFFIEEIVRRVIESGKLDEKEIVTAESIQIPGSIDAAVTSRIDSLNKEAKYLLKIASIIGRSFPQELLQEIVREKESFQHIDELEAAEFLVKINKDNKMFYAFRHALFQEVAYNSLLKSERTIYHKVIAETIENKFKEEIDGYFGALAHHYYICKVYDKALDYSLKAGDEAASLYANEEALAFYNQALSVSEDKAQRASILERIGNIELMIGRIEQAAEHYEQAKKLAQDKSQKAQIMAKVAKLLEQTGKIDESIKVLRQAIKTVEDIKSAGYIELNYNLSNVLLESKAENEQAMMHAENGKRAAKKLGDKKLWAEGLRAQAHILWRQGKNEETLKLLKEAQDIYEDLGEVKVLPYLFLLVAAVYRAMGNINAAIEFVKKTIDTARKIGNKRILAMGYNNIGVYYSYLGDYLTAIDFTEKNVEIRRQISDKKGEGIGLMNIGLINMYIGRYDVVLDYYEKAVELFESINEIRSTLTAYAQMADVFMLQKQTKKAYELYEKSIKIAKETKDRSMIAETMYRVGDYYQDIGDNKKAMEYYEKAEPGLLECDEKHMLSELYSSIAAIHIQNNDTRALGLAEKSLKYAIETKVKNIEIRSLRMVGRAQAAVGNDPVEGIKNIKRSIAVAKEINALTQMAHSLLSLGEVLIADNKPDQALEYLNQAKKHFTDFNAIMYLEKTEALIKKIS